MTNFSQDSAAAPRWWSLSIADLTQAAVFAALIAVLGLPGQINLAAGVPITLQTLGVMLAGAVLGPKKGSLAVVIFMALAMGLPLLAGGRTGWTALSSPTGGYFFALAAGARNVAGSILRAEMTSSSVICSSCVNVRSVSSRSKCASRPMHCSASV